VQVVQLCAPDLPFLPALSNVSHLMLETYSVANVMSSLQGFPNLETLEIRPYAGIMVESFPAVDVTHLTRLKHLCIKSFAPSELRIGAACQVHALWDDEEDDPDEAHLEWLQSPVWHQVSPQLASFQFVCRSSVAEGAMQSLRVILYSAEHLEHLRLKLPSLGSAEEPFIASQAACLGLFKAKTVDIRVRDGCWLKFEDVNPSWKNFSVMTAGTLYLDMPDVCSFKGFAANLEGFSVQYKDLRGTVVTELIKALCCVGRKVQIEPSQRQTCRVYTQEEHTAVQTFDQLMECGCHACLVCLYRDRRLPSGYRPPAIYHDYISTSFAV